jgi:hypothetical protein
MLLYESIKFKNLFWGHEIILIDFTIWDFFYHIKKNDQTYL